jgi:hypothetical protein
MKRFFLGTFVSIVAVMGFAMLAARWPAIFWLPVVSVTLYLLFGRRADVEFRIGVGGADERQLYGAVVWKRRDRVPERAEGQESGESEASVSGREG